MGSAGRDTYVFHLRHGVLWHQKPPVNGRELVAEDVKFTFDRFLTEKANPLRYMLEPLDRIEVVNRYTLQFRLKEPYVWLVDMLANPRMWIIAREAVEQFGDLKKAESAIGTGPGPAHMTQDTCGKKFFPISPV